MSDESKQAPAAPPPPPSGAKPPTSQSSLPPRPAAPPRPPTRPESGFERGLFMLLKIVAILLLGFFVLAGLVFATCFLSLRR